MNAPTPSSPDPGHPRRSHGYDGRGAGAQPGPPAGPYDGHGASGGPDPYGGDAYGAYGDGPQHGGGGAYDAGHPGDHGYLDKHGPLEKPGHPGEEPAAYEKGPDARQEVRTGLLCAVAVGVLGVLLGLLWWWLAPRVPLVVVDGSVFLKDPEGEEAIGADGTFVLLALGFGVVTGALAFLRSREGGVGMVIGLAAGALLGSVLAWQLGVWLGPDADIAAAAKDVGENETFDGPLKLQAKSALLVWPLLALVAHLALTGLFGKRDELPEAGHGPYPPPGEETPPDGR